MGRPWHTSGPVRASLPGCVCHHVPVLHSLTRLGDTLRSTDERLRSGRGALPAPQPTGFPILDQFLGGGLRPGELTLLGGQQGLGKTSMALQMAREAARLGRPVLYVSYEHDAFNILQRLLAIEAGEQGGRDAVTMRDVRSVLEHAGDPSSLAQRLAALPGR